MPPINKTYLADLYARVFWQRPVEKKQNNNNRDSYDRGSS